MNINPLNIFSKEGTLQKSVVPEKYFQWVNVLISGISQRVKIFLGD